MMVQQSNLQPAAPIALSRAQFQILVALLLIQLPDFMPGKAEMAQVLEALPSTPEIRKEFLTFGFDVAQF